MTDDSSFRVVALSSHHVVRGVLAMQSAKGRAAHLLADLSTGMVLLRETMSPNHRVQGILKRASPKGYLLADSHPNGQTRGLLSLGSEPTTFELDGALLQVVRSLQTGQVHQGVVAVSGDATVAEALMTYMQESEQIVTMIGVNSVVTKGSIRAGGYLVQLLPGAERGALAVMTERLEDFRSIEGLIARDDFSPDLLLEELLYGMPYTRLDDSEVRAGCWCSRSSMLSALATVSKDDIQSMIDEGKVLEINCDYCTREYHVSPAELQGLTHSH